MLQITWLIWLLGHGVTSHSNVITSHNPQPTEPHCREGRSPNLYRGAVKAFYCPTWQQFSAFDLDMIVTEILKDILPFEVKHGQILSDLKINCLFAGQAWYCCCCKSKEGARDELLGFRKIPVTKILLPSTKKFVGCMCEILMERVSGDPHIVAISQINLSKYRYIPIFNFLCSVTYLSLSWQHHYNKLGRSCSEAGRFISRWCRRWTDFWT